MLLQVACQLCTVCGASAHDVALDLTKNNSVTSPADPIAFSNQYTKLTKDILLAGIELERFSLNFRMESAKQPKFRKLRYFAAQEAGAAGLLAFETTGVDQFGKARKHPLQLNKSALHRALATATTTSSIASASSAFELGVNIVQMIKNKQHGYDPKSATKYVRAKMDTIDALLKQREALVALNSESPAYARAMAEGKVLHEVRSAFVNEYTHFNADTRAYLAYQNLFYALNASYNGVGAVAASIAYRAVDRPHLNGTGNILFIVSGGLATVTPIICQSIGNYTRLHASSSVKRELGAEPFDINQFALDCKNLQTFDNSNSGTLIATLPATERFAIYGQSRELFTAQLDSETKQMRKLEKVALQTTYLGPVIGSLLMTQGILGTNGYYRYPLRIRKQITQYYYGSICGTIGSSMALVGNAASILGTLSYEHKLSKQKASGSTDQGSPGASR